MLNVTGVLSLDTSNPLASVRRDEKNSNRGLEGLWIYWIKAAILDNCCEPPTTWFFPVVLFLNIWGQNDTGRGNRTNQNQMQYAAVYCVRCFFHRYGGLSSNNYRAVFANNFSTDNVYWCGAPSAGKNTEKVYIKNTGICRCFLFFFCIRIRRLFGARLFGGGLVTFGFQIWFQPMIVKV